MTENESKLLKPGDFVEFLGEMKGRVTEKDDFSVKIFWVNGNDTRVTHSDMVCVERLAKRTRKEVKR